MTLSPINPIVLSALLPLLLLAGCSKNTNPDGRQDVSGTITFNGGPLTGIASIRFEPTDGGDGGGVGQIMENGSYLLTGPDGVKPGKYIVRIGSRAIFDLRTGKIADNTLEFGDEYPMDAVPPEFNQNSTIEFEVVKNKTNTFNYDIQTDFVPQPPPGAKSPLKAID